MTMSAPAQEAAGTEVAATETSEGTAGAGDGSVEGLVQQADGTWRPAEEGEVAAAADATKVDDLSAGETATRTAREAARRAKSQRSKQKNLEREVQVLRQQAAAAADLRQRIQADPVAALRAEGLTDTQIAEHMARHAGPEDAMEVLRQQNLALQQRLDNWETGQKKERVTKQVHEIRQKFIEEASKDEYPLLSEAPEDVVHGYVRRAIDHVDSQGDDANDYEFSELVAIAEKIYENSRRKKVTPASLGNGTGQANGKVNGKVAPPPPRSLSNEVLARVSSKPPNFEQLPLDEQEKILDRIYFNK